MVRSIFQEVNSFSTCQEVTQTFIIVFTRIRHLYPPWTVAVSAAVSHPLSLRFHFNIILPSTPWSSKRFFPSLLPTKTPYSFIFFMRAICRAHLILLDCITLIKFSEQHESWSRSQWPRGLRHGSTPPRFLGLPPRISPVRHIYVL